MRFAMASAFSAGRAALLMLALSPVLPTAAQACSVIVEREPTAQERRRAARQALERASAIVDGEVVRPFVRGGQPALVRALRVLKGPQQTYFEVGEESSCDEPLEQAGFG